jgi:hypothetical protein
MKNGLRIFAAARSARRACSARLAAACFACFVCLAAALPFAGSGGKFARAENVNPLTGGDGTYECGYTVGGTSEAGKGMIAASCAPTLRIERANGLYYLHLTLLSARQMQNVKMTTPDGKRVGDLVYREEGDTRAHMFALSAASLQRDLTVSMYITAMSGGVSFTARADLSGAEKISDGIDESVGERPAEFVPVIATNAEPVYLLKKGGVFTVPPASAAIGAEAVPVSAAAFYEAGGGARESVAIAADGTFTLGRAGGYSVVYTAASDVYKTSLGNPSSATLECRIVSSADGGEQGSPIYTDALTGISIEDAGGAVSGFAEIRVTAVNGGALYEAIGGNLRRVGAKFKATEVALTDGGGGAVPLNGSVKVSLLVQSTFDKSKIAVYYADADGNLTQLSGATVGNYFVFETDKLGVFVVAERGAGGWPAWGVALAVIGGAAVLCAAGAAVYFFKKKKGGKANGREG